MNVEQLLCHRSEEIVVDLMHFTVAAHTGGIVELGTRHIGYGKVLCGRLPFRVMAKSKGDET